MQRVPCHPSILVAAPMIQEACDGWLSAGGGGVVLVAGEFVEGEAEGERSESEVEATLL